jgi:acyl dehydratase
MTVTPDRYVTYRYAGASGDFNPIHLDDEFARSVGLPGRILHGLWTMAQVARAQGELAGDPLALRSLSVQFRGLGVPEKEITIASDVRSSGGGEARVACEAVQDGNKLVRRGAAVLRI